MNWKNPKGYKLSGIIRGSAYSSTPIFVIKTQRGIGWVSVGYLDPWNSGHASHQLEGVLSNEGKNRITFKSIENDFDLVIEELEENGIKDDFDRLTEPYMKSVTMNYSYEGQHKIMVDMFKEE